jgi:hypothetical protein
MKLIKYLALAIAGFTALSLSAYDDGDFQTWLSVSAKTQLNEKSTLLLSQEFRSGDDSSELYDVETFLAVSYKVSDAFKVSYGHLHIELKSGDDWNSVDVPTLDFIFTQPVAEGWKLEERVRIEYNIVQNGDDYDRYRFRFKLKSPWKWTSMGINPYVAVEPFYYNKDGYSGWNRLRIYVGATMKVTDNVSGHVFYLRQRDDKGDWWRDYNILGASLGFSF